MTRLHHVHSSVRTHVRTHVRPALARLARCSPVRYTARQRKPEANGPAFRLAALLAGFAVSAASLAVLSPGAAAAERHATRHRTAPDPAPPRALDPLRHPARPALVPGARAALTSAPAGTPRSDLRGASPGRPGTPLPAGGQDAAGEPPRDATENTPPRDAAPMAAAPEDAVAERAAAPDTLSLPKGQLLGHRFVKGVLSSNDIRWRSTGGCSDRTVPTCTSFEQIRWGTIKGLIDFAESSGCEITVTGGTERGHADGTYSHWNGYKADIAPSSCVDRAIKRYTYTGVRGDGAKLYRSPDGTVFAREKNHWDITFK